MADQIPPGTIAWIDLTVGDAPNLRDFYAAVTGWSPEPLDMDDYDDFVMNAADGSPAAGICHARGVNEGLPPVWLVYIAVDDLDQALIRVEMCGGKVIVPPREAFTRYAVIQDPAGAMCALYVPVQVEGIES